MSQESENRKARILAALSAARNSVPHISSFVHKLASIDFWRVFLTFVSAVTTWIGMMLLYGAFGGDHGGASMAWLRFIIPLAMAGSIHAAIFWALRQWVGTKRTSFLALAIPLQIIAIVASYGTHWTGMQGASVTTASYIDAQRGVFRGLMTFVQSYQSLSTETKALSDHSQAEATIEEKDGTSCGARAGDGQGPRYRLRMADRDIYTAFNTQVADRMTRLQSLANQAEAISATTADDAMVKIGGLRRIVDEAKPYEGDPVLSALRKSAEARIAAGRVPMTDTSGPRGKAATQTFSCSDVMLERHLQSVVDAIDGLKPLPDADVQDARNPRIGFALALHRLGASTFGARLFPSDRTELERARVNALHGSGHDDDGIQSGDIPPLVIAFIIEATLTLLFWIGGGNLPLHPGMSSLRSYLSRPIARVIPMIWSMLRAGSDPASLQRVLQSHVNFQNRAVLVIFPLYSADPDIRALHQLMELLSAVKLAKKYYTGRALFGLFAAGWPDVQKLAVNTGGPVRVYRMNEADYLAVLLDVLGENPTSAPDPTRGQESGSAELHVVASGTARDKAA
jgi:hypothetical protein